MMDWLLLWTIALWCLAWYPCCCETGSAYPCSNCSGSVPTSVSIIISGAMDRNNCNTCDDDLNGTHVLPEWTTCKWKKGNVGLSCGDPSGSSYNYYRITAGAANTYCTTNVHWQINVNTVHVYGLHGYFSTYYFIWDSGSTSPMDCTVDRSLSLWTPSPAPTQTSCDLSSATVSIDIP